ncbi:MAG: hypothetical protein R2784_08205 [Saprospiraceae bacterium]
MVTRKNKYSTGGLITGYFARYYKTMENLLNASDEIKAIIAKAEKDVFPQDLSVTIFNDQSIANPKHGFQPGK